MYAASASSVQSSSHSAPRPSPRPRSSRWPLKRGGAPSPSPDAKWVVFLVTEPSYEEKKQIADLWIVPTDGSAQPRRLTDTQAAESDVAWSPDSSRIAFSA